MYTITLCYVLLLFRRLYTFNITLLAFAPKMCTKIYGVFIHVVNDERQTHL